MTGLETEARRLHDDYDVHLFPADAGKKPGGKWRKGEKDYVLERQTDEELERWLRRKPQPPGWIGLCGGPAGWLCLDIEAAGMTDPSEKGQRIREWLARFPRSAKRTSPSGGMHVWLKVTDGPARSGTYLIRRLDGVDEQGHPLTTLLAELRGHGQYALLIGFGRPRLAEDFAPHPMTVAEVDEMFDSLREISDLQPVKRRRVERIGEPSAPEARDWEVSPPRDTADVLAWAVVQGLLSWTDVLDDGWTEAGATTDGWSLWLRPDYGSPSSAGSSANGRELVGIPSLTVHSSSVPWAEPEVSYSPAEVLALSGRVIVKNKPLTSFADVMFLLESAAMTVIRLRRKVAQTSPFSGWDPRILAAIENLLPRQNRPPLIVRDWADTQDEMADALGSGPTSGLFRRGDEMVHCPRMGEDGYIEPLPDGWNDGPAQVRQVDANRLKFTIERSYYVCNERMDGDGHVHVTHEMFPRDVATGLASSPAMLPALRPLRGVIHTPVFRADGSLLDTEGYDDETGLLFLPTLPTPKIPDYPTEDDVAEARALISEMLAGFRWITEHDRANFIGALLLPLLMLIIPPPWPMVMITAPQTGAGKTLLTSLLIIIHGGVQRSALSAEAEEVRKQIAAILLTTTATVVAFDNTEKTVSGNVLADLLTTDEKSDRLLGQMLDVKLRNNRLWVANGNNMSAGGDLSRRLLWVSFNPGTEHPELLEFPIKNLKRWARERRGELLAALLTLVRSWVLAGMPTDTSEHRSDDFARPAEVLRGLLAKVGIPGTFQHPDTNRAPLSEDDQEWAEFLRALHEDTRLGVSWRAKRLRDLLDTGCDRLAGKLPTVMEQRYHDIRHPLSARSIGRFLRNRDGRVTGGYVLKSALDRDGIAVFWVENVSSQGENARDAGSVGFTGSVSSASYAGPGSGFRSVYEERKRIDTSAVATGEKVPANPTDPSRTIQVVRQQPSGQSLRHEEER